MLQIDGPEDLRAAVELIRNELSDRVQGHRMAVARLALIGARHLAGSEMQRALIMGPTGCGKTTLMRCLADCLDRLDFPTAFIDVSQLAEQNWSGADLSDVIGALYHETRIDPGADHHDRVERAVILLDEVDSISLHAESEASRAYHVGKQRSLTALLGRGAIPVEGVRGVSHWPTHRALVLAAGEFAGVTSSSPSASDLIDWGMLPAVAERFGAGAILGLQPLGPDDMFLVLLQDLDVIEREWRGFGFDLIVTEEALSYVVREVMTRDDTGLRTAFGWLRDACDRALIGLIEQDAAPGSRFTLTPDDVRFPPPTRWTWRDP